MYSKQEEIEASERNYEYIEYYRKAYGLETDPEQKEFFRFEILEQEAFRDYHTETLRQINNLIQIGKPNLELEEPKEELYKISVSRFMQKSKSKQYSKNETWPKMIGAIPYGPYVILNPYFTSHVYDSVGMDEIMEMRDTNDRVLFQNAEGNINMGVFFNDPNHEMSDLCWYNILAKQLEDVWMDKEENGELVSYDQKRNTLSCYVELHRNGASKILLYLRRRSYGINNLEILSNTV